MVKGNSRKKREQMAAKMDSKIDVQIGFSEYLFWLGTQNNRWKFPTYSNVKCLSSQWFLEGDGEKSRDKENGFWWQFDMESVQPFIKNMVRELWHINLQHRSRCEWSMGVKIKKLP